MLRVMRFTIGIPIVIVSSHRCSGTVGNSYSGDSFSKAIRSWKEPFKTQRDQDLLHGVCEYYVLGVIPAPSTAISES